MTKHDLMEMADQIYGDQDWTESTLTRLERFANLVAAKERERICKQIAVLHDSLSLASSADIRSLKS